MAHSRERSKGRMASGSFAAFPHSILESPEYADLSPRAVKLLLDLFAQYRGSNNGDLSAPWGLMKRRGWRSKDTLNKARLELIEKGWLVQTRQGGIHKCSLFAVTWLRIDECGGKLDSKPPPGILNTWKTTFVPRGRGTVPRTAGQSRRA